MKKQKFIMTGILAAGGLLLAGALQLQAQNLLIYSSSVNTGGTEGGAAQQWVGSGAPGTGGANLYTLYDNGLLTWDSTETDPASDGGGSVYVTAPFSSALCCGKPIMSGINFDYDNWYYNGNGTVDFSQYNAVQFDILWDTANSNLGVDQFNTLDNWPLADLPGWNSDPNYLAEQGCTPGLEIDLDSGSGGGMTYLGNFNIPDSCSNGWVQVTVPYSPAVGGPGVGISFQKWLSANWAITGTVTFHFWIDNVYVLPAPSGPPTMAGMTPAIPGEAIYNATEGNSYYDRNEIVTTTTSGLSWANPSSTFPVSYSYDMEGFPNGTNASGESYMLLVPNAPAVSGGPDWSYTTIFYFQVNSATTGGGAARGGAATVSYKTSQYNVEPNLHPILGGFTGPSAAACTTNSIASANLYGNYTLTFTGLDAGTITTPDGTQGTFALPAGTGATYFAEGVTESQGTTNQANTVPFAIYLGGQANQAPAMNQAFVYASFTATGVSGAATTTENFVTDANQPTPALVNWTNGVSTQPASDVLVPSAALYLVSWDLPANGYSLVNGTSLASPNWKDALTYSSFPLYQERGQYVGAADMQSSPTGVEYFALVQRVYTAMLIALPNETFVSGTGITGYGLNGAQHVAATIYGGNPWNDTATVYAVDAGNNLVTTLNNNVVTLTSTTDAAFNSGSPVSVAFANGVAAFSDADAENFTFGTGDQQNTVTATDGTTSFTATSDPVFCSTKASGSTYGQN
ncbi:MAG: hypothetical protein ACLQU4_01280 [Limisphaerales bacterium]